MVFDIVSCSSSDASKNSVSQRDVSASMTFSERKYKAEGQDFDLAKQLLFAEDPMIQEFKLQAKDDARVSKWCKNNGYQDVITPKRTFRGARKFPLHTAVKQQDVRMARLLIRCGASTHAMASNGLTPCQLAESMDPGHVQDQMMAALRV
eukprot:CAMPEP_0169083230 /NCGR_PEP_ID=MMETSP1015-20121227/11971_1 /TAXON_ID=342587 /ORGANISM="Karlodinium micrum, Strain CCMP2283" /LENGTH=149 /DNA_ID=CAMNT_0009143147 /DNA_START=37 /DNA_END=486 /DNA_ORIENTATION=+